MTQDDIQTTRHRSPPWIRAGWIAAIAVLGAVRLWNALTGPLLRGYDDLGHVAYVLYLDLYHSVPWADQGWSYFHPPLHYLFGWALAQLDSPLVLLRGLSFLGGALSLAIAALAARVTRLANPGRDDLPLLAFVAVGSLPVYLYTSTTAGNELTAAFFGTLGLALLIANECRTRPALGRDALAGLAIGLALLTKASAVLVLVAAGAALGLRVLREQPFAASLRRNALRGLVLTAVAVAIAAPYYARNVREFGTPFKMSRDNPHVVRLESSQGPGSRTWVDFVSLPPKLLLDPDTREEHLLHSVWGSAYAQTWADSRMSWDTLGARHRPHIRRVRSVMAILGLAPTLLALVGGVLGFVDLLRGRRAAVYVPVFASAAVSLVSFAGFAVAAPHYSALKASYLLGLTLPYAVFLMRGLEVLGGIATRAGAGLAAVAVVVPSLAACFVYADGVVLPRLGTHKAIGSMMFYFGDRDDHEAARLFYTFYQNQHRRVSPGGQVWTDNLGAVALVQGDPVRARGLYRTYPARPGRDPFRWNAEAVATALSGRPERAIEILEQAIEAGAGEVGLVNRGAVRASLGDLTGAESDLREALALDSGLAPAWHGLAEVLERAGRLGEAALARGRAERAASGGPRGYPYGIPDCLGQYPSSEIGFRWMLWLEGEDLLLARAPFRSEDAIPMRDSRSLLAPMPHVALFVIDTLRADHLGAYGYARPTSPRIDRLAREGVRFAKASATSSWTLPSVASLFTSKPPTVHGSSSWGQRLKPGHVTFVELLRKSGYRTLGVSGNFVHVTKRLGFARGFDTWKTLSVELESAQGDALFVQERDGVGLRAPTADEINAAVFENLPAEGEEPLFLYVHYMEPHSGYDPPERHRLRFVTDPAAHAAGAPVTSAYLTDLVRERREIDARERQRLIDLYDAEIASVDQAIGDLLDELEARGFAEELVVVVVSDHGEEFGDHRSWFHGLTLHGESLTVPLVIWDSRRSQPGVVVEEPVDLMDIPTTILALAGVEPAPGMRGRNLLAGGGLRHRELRAALEADPLFEDHVGPRHDRRALTRWPWKLIVDRKGDVRVYQLERDPGETAPLALDDPMVPRRLRRAATKLVAELSAKPEKPASKRPKPASEPSEQDRERLRALGYAE